MSVLQVNKSNIKDIRVLVEVDVPVVQVSTQRDMIALMTARFCACCADAAEPISC